MVSEHAQFVGNIPETYDLKLGPLLFEDYAEDIARRVAALAPNDVLETACGTGIVSLALRRALALGTSLTSTDLNAPMVAIAQAKAGAEGIRFQIADAQDLPFPDGCFDVVVCQFGVMFYPDKDKAYREVRRVLRPGGRYVFSVWDSHEYNPCAKLAYETVQKVFPTDPPQFMKVPFSYPFEPIKGSLLANGFDHITASVVRNWKLLPEARVLAEGLIFGNPSIDQISARGTIDPEEIVAALTEAYHAAFGPDPAKMLLQALVVSAQKPV
jgi:ubiquinone/menaquinone biosynthesis C-methylase UbiE